MTTTYLILSIALCFVGVCGLVVLGACKLSSLVPASWKSDGGDDALIPDLAESTRRELIDQTNPEPPCRDLAKWLAFQGTLE